MAKGQEAKDRVVAKLRECFGSAFLGEQDKKFYIESMEDGQPMQVAISMTCPKTPFAGGNAATMATGATVLDWSHPEQKAQISAEDQAKVDELYSKLFG